MEQVRPCSLDKIWAAIKVLMTKGLEVRMVFCCFLITNFRI